MSRTLRSLAALAMIALISAGCSNSAAGKNRPTTEVASMVRSTISAACCAAAPTTCPRPPGSGCSTSRPFGDVHQQIGLRWIAAQELCLLYGDTDRYQAEKRPYRILDHCADSDVPELHRFARTLDAWRPSAETRRPPHPGPQPVSVSSPR